MFPCMSFSRSKTTPSRAWQRTRLLGSGHYIIIFISKISDVYLDMYIHCVMFVVNSVFLFIYLSIQNMCTVLQRVISVTHVLYATARLHHEYQYVRVQTWKQFADTVESTAMAGYVRRSLLFFYDALQITISICYPVQAAAGHEWEWNPGRPTKYEYAFSTTTSHDRLYCFVSKSTDDCLRWRTLRFQLCCLTRTLSIANRSRVLGCSQFCGYLIIGI